MSTEPSLPATTPPPRRSWRRWFRSLWVRVSLVLLLIAAIALFSVWWPRRVVWSVLWAGGEFHSSVDESVLRMQVEQLPAYLEPIKAYIEDHRDWLLMDRHMETISMWGAKVDDRWLSRLRGCSSLQGLYLNARQVGPGLESLARLPSLDWVGVSGSGPSSRLDELSRLPQLKSITLYDAEGPVGGLESLLQQPTLVNVSIFDPRKPKDIFRQLSGSNNLTTIELHCGTEPAGNGLLALASSPKLRSLSLFGILTDEELGSACQLQNLEALSLRGPVATYRASREGWRSLQRLPKLRELNVDVNEGMISFVAPPPADEGDPGLIEFLRTLLPGCTVNRVEPR